MRFLFIACAVLAACGDGSSHSTDVSQFIAAWQTTGGSGGWQCDDGTTGGKQVTAGDRYTIGAGTTQDLIATTSGGCTDSLAVSGNRATGDAFVCQGVSSGVDLTLVLSNDVLTWTQTISWTDPSHGNCSETDTILLTRVVGN